MTGYVTLKRTCYVARVGNKQWLFPVEAGLGAAIAWCLANGALDVETP